MISTLLFSFTGNEHDYMRLSLKDGRVSLAVQLGSGSPFDTSIRKADEGDEGRKNGVRFDDNEWHHVRVERRSSEVSGWVWVSLESGYVTGTGSGTGSGTGGRIDRLLSIVFFSLIVFADLSYVRTSCTISWAKIPGKTAALRK